LRFVESHGRKKLNPRGVTALTGGPGEGRFGIGREIRRRGNETMVPAGAKGMGRSISYPNGKLEVFRGCLGQPEIAKRRRGGRRARRTLKTARCSGTAREGETAPQGRKTVDNGLPTT